MTARAGMFKWKRSAVADGLFGVLNYALLLLVLVVSIYPFYYILIYSVSTPLEAGKGLYFLPRGLTLANYAKVLKLKGILNAAFISTARTFCGTVATVLCCSFFAYLSTKREMYLRRFVYRMLVVTMYFNAGLIPWYLTMKLYSLNNNFLLYILPSALSAFNVILVKTFIEQLPASLEESAKIDGAGYVRIFFKIVFPLSMPIVATIAVFSAVNQWNTWIDNYFLANTDRLNTLQLVLYKFLTEASRIATSDMQDLNRGAGVQAITPAAIRMTITMVVTMPILFVYPFLQKYFVKGIMMGAIKG